MLAYYPPTVNFRAIEKLMPSLGRLQDVREIQREKDVERKKMLGKGPPKKGKFIFFSRVDHRNLQEDILVNIRAMSWNGLLTLSPLSIL